MNADEPIVVYTTNNLADAEIRRSLLQGEGIKCELDSENQAGLVGLLDVNLLVRPQDEDRARKILAGHSSHHGES